MAVSGRLEASAAVQPKPRRHGLGWLVDPANSRLVRFVGRLPTPVRTKLLLAFGGSVVVLIVVVGLALSLLADSNGRVGALAALQQRATAYRELQTDAGQVRLLLGLRAGGQDQGIYAGSAPPSLGNLQEIDQAILSTLSRPGRPTDLSQLGFVPPPAEQGDVTTIQQDFARLSDVMSRIVAADQTGDDATALKIQRAEAEPLANELQLLTGRLVEGTQAATESQVLANEAAFSQSEGLFVAVAIAAILLALGLGFVLSWSVVGPLRLVEGSLARIAAGNFSEHVEVANRDELGALAANINRMNDELERLYGEIETANRNKSEFLSNMSHELRTPLNAVIGFSQVLHDQLFGELNAKQTEYINDVLSSGQHLLTLINDLLDLAKVEAGRMELQLSTFALQDTLINALSMVRERATRKGVALASELDPAVDSVEADERKLKQVLFNLLTNAVKFTPEGGAVTLGTRREADDVDIWVSDTGIGISPEDQAQLFEEFYQVGSAKTQEGTGLGLALTKRLVELQGGTIRVESKPGVGSTFSFTLPARGQSAAAPAAPTSTAAVFAP